MKDTSEDAKSQLEFYLIPLSAINTHPDFDVNVENMRKVVEETPQIIEQGHLWSRRKVTTETAAHYLVKLL